MGDIYSWYRIALSLILGTLFVLTYPNPLVGADAPFLYAQSSIFYFFFSLIAYVCLRYFAYKQLQLLTGVVVDIFILTLMLYANGGPNIQVSMLYLVTVIASFVLLSQKKAIFITIFAIICVTYQQFFYSITKQTNVRGMSNIALLSVSFIGIALLGHFVTTRLREIEDVAEIQATQMAQLNFINQRIIEIMDNGVLVLDTKLTIKLCNKAAQRILGFKYTRPQKTLAGIDIQLEERIGNALSNEQNNIIFSPVSSHITEALSINIHQLDEQHILLLIERISKTQQQAQQMKLASLGRLTASIAHEIRNPIGAISQASQLLQDDPNDSNAPLYRIIYKQTRRVNQIIEDILQLSKKTKIEQQTIQLYNYVTQLAREHFSEQHLQIQIADDIFILFNPAQLEQVLVNIIQNGFQHGASDNQMAQVKVIASKAHGQVDIDIIDSGDGVSATDQLKLFEPFFTTAATGTGLGLYISKAFCEANGASLNYVPNRQGSCFRISANFST